MTQIDKLFEVASVFNGKTPSRQEQRSVGHPVLKVKDVSEDGLFRGTFDSFVDEELVDRLPEKRIRNGDILILNAAHNAEYVASKVYRAEPQVVGALATGEWLIIRPDLARMDPVYAYYRILFPPVRRQLRSSVTGIHLYPSRVGELSFPLPPLPEQKRIAAILDLADGIRRKRRQAESVIDQLVSSSFNKRCGPAAAAYDKWPVRELRELASRRDNSIRTGPFGSDLRHSEFVEKGIAVLGIDNAVKNRFAWGERRYISDHKYLQLKRYTVRPGDVLITIMGTTGRSAVAPEDLPLSISTKHLAVITVDRDMVEPEFLSHAIHTHPLVLRQINGANRGAIMSGLNLSLVTGLKIPLPPLSEQRSFVAFLKAARCIQERIAMGPSPDDLFQSLLHEAFSGRMESKREV